MTDLEHSQYLNRCYLLAQLSGKETGTNPKVGAVLVHDKRIIGEGRHERYGGNHAEINALKSVLPKDKDLIPKSTLYVSLEPCCITGKTPPCTSAILEAGIKKVHIGTIDPFPKIDGKGVNLLRDEGVYVKIHNDPKAVEQIAPFTTFHIKKRPFVTLKFAKSKDNFIGKENEQVWLSNSLSSIYTHKLRSQSHAILVGTNTAILDNPKLTNRHHYGDSPLRLVIDKTGRIPHSHHLLSDKKPTVIFNLKSRPELPATVSEVTLTSETNFTKAILDYCYSNQLSHLVVEGGAKLIRSFIKTNSWDRALILQTNHMLTSGIKAPLVHGRLQKSIVLGSDHIFDISNSEQ